MKQYTPEKLVAVSRYKVLFPTLSPEIQRDVYSRMRVLIEEEKQYCDQGNYKHLAQILTTIALYAASWHTLFVSEDDPVHSAEPRMNKILFNVKAPETLYGLRELLSIKTL